jgi:RHS repeat-associated protein
MSYTYDADSNRASMTDPQSGVTSYVYDTLNRLSTLTPPTVFGSGPFGFTYDTLSRRTQMTRPNGVTTTYTYNNLSQLLSVLHQVGANTIDGAVYTVDPAGNRTVKTDKHANVTSNYTYDPLYELTQVTQSTTTTETYSFDPVGNRLTSLGVSPYSINTSNELTSIPGTTYTYDSNGNTLTKVTSSGTTTFGWDYENRLTSVTLPGTGGALAFKYDGFGHRVQKAFTQGSTTTTTNYLYDGNNAVADVDQNGNVLARYTTMQNTDEPLAELRSATTSYYSQDGLGSVTSLTTSAGALGNTYTYDSFGKLTASTGSIANRFQYTAREFDSETGLYSYRARYYDSNAGRFLSEDPVKSAVRLNRYKYVNNSPNILSDPTGLTEQCTFNESQQISPWIDSVVTTADSGWHFLQSYAEGPEDPLPWITVTCSWDRKVTKTEWKSALFLLSWNCVETAPCGATRYRIKYSLRKQSEYVSTTQDVRDTDTTSFFSGPEDDEANDLRCLLDHQPME